MTSERDTCKTETTMVDTVVFVPTLKSVRDQRKKELRSKKKGAKRRKISASKMRELTFTGKKVYYLYSIV